jgi:hypothetical protein
LTGFLNRGFIVASLGKVMAPAKILPASAFCRPSARRSRLAGHGSPVFLTTTDAGAGFPKFASRFTVAAFVPHHAGQSFAESASPSNHAGGGFAESGTGLPKSAVNLAKSAACFTDAGVYFTKSGKPFAESALPFAKSAGTLPDSEPAFPQRFADKNPVYPPIPPIFAEGAIKSAFISEICGFPTRFPCLCSQTIKH